MTIKIISGNEIRNEVLKILSGACLFERRPNYPCLYILTPWISDVNIELSDPELQFVKDETQFDFFILDFNIKSINLPYALLLLKLHSAARVNIVTLPPQKMNLSPDYLPRVITLLDFLDEIGCNVFVNSELHSKLLVSNDLALLGSFNLSSSALYYREEIGISINDLDNLDRLEGYCSNLILKSEPYGYSSLLNWGETLDIEREPLDYSLPPTSAQLEVVKQQLEARREKQFLCRERITRGWLLDYMVEHGYCLAAGLPERYREFLNVIGDYDELVKAYYSNLNVFYLTSLRRLISSPDGRICVEGCFRYDGDDSTDSIMKFVNTRFARKKVPDIKLQIKSLSKQ